MYLAPQLTEVASLWTILLYNETLAATLLATHFVSDKNPHWCKTIWIWLILVLTTI